MPAVELPAPATVENTAAAVELKRPETECANTRPGLTLNRISLDWRAAMQSNQWRPVRGFEGYYEVSNTGDVRSLTRIDTYGRRRQGRPLVPAANTSGHLYVKLTRGNRKTKRYVHRLVIDAFVGPGPEGTECCHNDGDPANNHVGNLRWDTHKENVRDTIRHGRNVCANKTHCLRGHPLVEFNITPWSRQGKRNCYACSKAHDRLGHRGRTDMQIESDRAFRELVAAHGA